MNFPVAVAATELSKIDSSQLRIFIHWHLGGVFLSIGKEQLLERGREGKNTPCPVTYTLTPIGYRCQGIGVDWAFLRCIHGTSEVQRILFSGKEFSILCAA